MAAIVVSALIFPLAHPILAILVGVPTSYAMLVAKFVIEDCKKEAAEKAAEAKKAARLASPNRTEVLWFCCRASSEGEAVQLMFDNIRKGGGVELFNLYFAAPEFYMVAVEARVGRARSKVFCRCSYEQLRREGYDSQEVDTASLRGYDSQKVEGSVGFVVYDVSQVLEVFYVENCRRYWVKCMEHHLEYIDAVPRAYAGLEEEYPRCW
eukprot:CAMPEP_0206448568 /NCGR_PEP_ID=MMETSP0324_2-20121206/17548_1 /ASSEMBLY_ACC=CAM_ASM_000836 /TAXON_ID=2866 /ORGANISM="Crypthecodinium cohnii, Strain Seligo" /LENGTH=208 /DNA_ID=CAMNT_0053917733 /DNA_START=162 /DNA_END=785 /DNA_ORIENTATION=-